MNRSFWYERVIYYIMGAGIVLAGFGFASISMTARESRFSERASFDGWITFCWILVQLGACIFLFSLIYGLALALGFGPARTIQEVVVESKITTLDDGTPTFDEAPDDVAVKRYLRLRGPDGEVIEARCTQAVYHACGEGTMGNAKVTGAKLVSFDITGTRS
jgi:hypothetical protein